MLSGDDQIVNRISLSMRTHYEIAILNCWLYFDNMWQDMQCSRKRV